MNRHTAFTKYPSRLYGTTVVSLAAFFVGLIVWRAPVDGYVAVSEIGRRVLAQPDQNDQLTVVNQEGLDADQFPALHQSLADAIRFADARLKNAAPHFAAEVSDERIRSTQSRLNINVRQSPECARTICISYAGADPTWSLALVEQLTRDCLLATSRSPESRTSSARAVRDARWRLDQTRHYERKARLGVEDLVDGYFAQLRGPATGSSRVAESVSDVNARAGDEGEMEINPEWQALQSHLAELAQQLRPLVEHLTPNHPLILDLTQRMEAVRQQLASTPQYVGQQVAPPDDAVSGQGVAAAPASHVAAIVESYTDDYQKLRKAYEDAVGDREEAERRLGGLMVRPTMDTDSHAESRWLITPPTLQGRIGGRASARRVGLVGLLALTCGCCVAWLLGTLKGLQRINTVADLEQVLSVPVVGQLSIDPVPMAAARLSHRGRLLKAVVVASELALGLLLVVFLTGAIASNPASRLLWDDPFTAIPDTVVQALQRWL
jgi:hypothetical protein